MHTRLVTVCVVTTVRCDGALQRDRVSGKRCCRIKGVTVGRYPRSWDGHSLCLVIGLYGLGRVLHLGIHTGREDGEGGTRGARWRDEAWVKRRARG